jgi:metal-responsive CopG/Arc/MetJ family transcriptional regulator
MAGRRKKEKQPITGGETHRVNISLPRGLWVMAVEVAQEEHFKGLSEFLSYLLRQYPAIHNKLHPNEQGDGKLRGIPTELEN